MSGNGKHSFSPFIMDYFIFLVPLIEWWAFITFKIDLIVTTSSFKTKFIDLADAMLLILYAS